MPRAERDSDRRRGLRFEIVGRLHGTIAGVEPLTVRNLSLGGALVEAPFTLPLESLHVVRLGSEANFGTVDVRVCHLGPAVSPSRHLIGLEFVTPDPLTARRIQQFVADAASSPA